MSSPSVDPAWESLYDHPDRWHSRYLQADGYSTHYVESGRPDAPPLVLVHGGNFQTGMASDRWYPTILPLARNFRVFAVDELGGGGTDAPRDLRDIGDAGVRARHVVAFVEALGVGPVHLVGQSQGAFIAAYVALSRPDLVRGLVMADCASVALPAGGVDGPIDPGFAASFLPGTMFKADLKPTRAQVYETVATMVFDKTMISDALLDRLVPLAEKWIPIWEEPWKAFWEDGGERNRRQYLMPDGRHLSEHIQDLRSPPLLIWGKNSVKGIDNGVDLYKKIPDAQFHVFDKANHFLWLDQWKDFNSLVTWYLKERGRF